jgi:membrane protein required for colicin V production
MEDLTTIDINIIIIIAVSTILALFRGLTREVLAITGWILAAYAALFLGPLIAPFLGNYIKVEWLASAICLILVFIIVLTVFSLFSRNISHSMQKSSIGALDRTLGLLFGVVRGMFIVSLAYLLLLLILEKDQQPEWITNAKLFPAVQLGANTLYQIIPTDNLPIDQEKLNEIFNASKQKATDLGTEILREQIEDRLDTMIDGTTDDNPASESDNKGQDNEVGKGYNDIDRTTLESLIKGADGAQ